jgi:hypothetical protein
MDLNPREAVVDQESSHSSEQGEKPVNALIVPANFTEAAMDGLKRQAVLQNLVVGTYCFTTRHPRRDYQCGDVAQ